MIWISHPDTKKVSLVCNEMILPLLTLPSDGGDFSPFQAADSKET